MMIFLMTSSTKRRTEVNHAAFVNVPRVGECSFSHSFGDAKLRMIDDQGWNFGANKFGITCK